MQNNYKFKDLQDLYDYFDVKDWDQMNRIVYKSTTCGAWFRPCIGCVRIGTIVEGSDAEFQETLRFPFTLKQWDKALGSLDHQANVEWDLCHS